MNYQETVNLLYTKLPMFQKVGGAALKYDLKNVRCLMSALDNPQDKLNFIHVAGTNGKGSSSHMLAAIMQSAGYKTGLFTSPHLKSFTERIRINGQEIAENEVVDFVEKINPLIDEIKPSFFEITFAMAINYFFRARVDIAVIEVGMGGRLDSSNIITPLVSLITNISLDHQQYLGSTLPEIAKEKAGIIKKGVPVIISEYQQEVAQVFMDMASELNSPLIFAAKEYHLEQAADERYNIIDKKRGIVLEGAKMALVGLYQKSNILGVYAVVEYLRSTNGFTIEDNAIRLGLANVISLTGLKGRWQVIKEKPLVIADTGHNLAGIKILIEAISRINFEQLHMVWGVVNDKDGSEILKILPKHAQYYFVNAAIPRAKPAEILFDEASQFGLKGSAYPSVTAGYNAALASATPMDLIFVGGSTFVVAELEEL